MSKHSNVKFKKSFSRNKIFLFEFNMKNHKYFTLIPYICKLLSAKNDFSVFPFYVAYKLIAEYLQQLKRKSCLFRLYLGMMTIFRIMINLIN